MIHSNKLLTKSGARIGTSTPRLLSLKEFRKHVYPFCTQRKGLRDKPCAKIPFCPRPGSLSIKAAQLPV